MTFYANTSAGNAIVDSGAPVTAPDGTQYPGNWDKSTLSFLHLVSEVAQPTPPAGSYVNGWALSTDGTYTQVWTITAYTAAQLATQAAQAIQQEYAAVLNAGVIISSASTPAIDGTYSISDSAISNIQAQQISILTKGQFTNGQTARPWIDTSGNIHVFPNTALFTEFAVAVGQYVDALTMALATAEAGGGWAPPAQPAPIP